MARAPAPADTALNADPLVVVRAEDLPARTGIVDPHAAWFVTDSGRMLARLARQIDPMYVPFNLARYRRFSRLLVEAADRVSQIVILGAGYDTRPLWLSGIAGRSDVLVFEVDFARTLFGKAAVLKRHGVALPASLRFAPADLNEPGLVAALKRAGFRPDRPAAVFAEGLMVFLARAAMTWIIDPKRFRLRSGSTIAFDYWSERRVDAINRAVMAGSGRAMFSALPYPEEPAELAAHLVRLGYADVEVTALSGLANVYWPTEHHTDPLGAWHAVTATVAGA